MNMSETDIELLETYLDGQMSLPEAEGLWRRLSVENSLTQALDDMRAQRAVRAAVWQSMEPTDAAAAELADRVNQAIRTRSLWEWARRGMTYAAAAAACIVIGVQIGRMEPGQTPMATAPVQTVAFQVPIHDQTGNLIATPQFATRQEAEDFVKVLNTEQNRAAPQFVSSPEQPNPGQNVVPVSDEQY